MSAFQTEGTVSIHGQLSNTDLIRGFPVRVRGESPELPKVSMVPLIFLTPTFTVPLMVPPISVDYMDYMDYMDSGVDSSRLARDYMDSYHTDS